VLPEPVVFADTSTASGAPPVSVTRAPHFDDDQALRGLSTALERQLDASDTRHIVRLADKTYTAAHVRRSARRMLVLVRAATACMDGAAAASRRACIQEFDRAVRAEFDVYTTRDRAHLTAYYTPTIDVVREPSGEYRYPIYALPGSDELRRADRHAIDFRHVLAGHGLELFYARDRFEVYLLHVEGGGKARAHGPDGGVDSTSYLSYAGDNGRDFRLLEEIMVERGMLAPRSVSRQAQRRYLLAHPQTQENIYAACPGYVYFRATQTPPVGSAGVPLTPGRTLASDPDYYALKGLIAYVVTRVPVPPVRGTPLDANPCCPRYRDVQRFFIDQDKGPEIKGAARFDLFFGEDDEAMFLANNFHTDGRVYFLVLK
jgi:membrane-bound lytic murein transglycosylase A